jgi:hypothetical protein
MLRAARPQSQLLVSQTRRFTISSFKREQQQISKPTTPAQPKTATQPPARGHKDQLPVYPLIAIFFLGSGAFYFLAKTRAGTGESHYVLPDRAPPKDQWPRTKDIKDS